MAFLLGVSLAANAQLFKCKNPEGTVSFQDSECPSGSSGTKLAEIQSPGAQSLTITADMHGQFHVPLSINGIVVDSMIDTGATNIAISAATAAQMGIPLAGSTAGGAMTANGVIPTLSKIIPIVRIGNIELENVEISITPNSPTLIGMSVLRRLKISAANGQMTLSK